MYQLQFCHFHSFCTLVVFMLCSLPVFVKMSVLVVSHLYICLAVMSCVVVLFMFLNVIILGLYMIHLFLFDHNTSSVVR